MVKNLISPAEVRLLHLTRQEVSFLDVREEADFARSHPLFASQLSAGRVEIEIFDKVPRLATLVVVYDDGEGLAIGAAARLETLGYRDVRVLDGGLAGWRAAGYELFEDVNSYAKAFGELVEARRHTPSLSAREVQKLIEEKASIAIVDVRRFEEYRTMNIPTSTNVPGAELVLRATAVAPNPDTTVIVNCAGRTRSIIGTQSLINAGVPNPVVALRNGTIGWVLAGQTLEHGQQRCAPKISDETALALARARARSVAYAAGVRRLTRGEVDRIAADCGRTLYRFDVRTPEEYIAGHVAGFRGVPGGQLVQEIDNFAAVRGARIVLADDHGIRADMTASWLAQMGWEVHVLDDDHDGELVTGNWRSPLPARPDSIEFIEADLLAERLSGARTTLIDLARSPEFRAAHIPGASFALRAELTSVLPSLSDNDIVLTSPDGALAEFAAADLTGAFRLSVLKGGTSAWIESGRPTESGLARQFSEPRDVYKRPYEGTDNDAGAMQAYLDWEYGLTQQLERDASHGFFVI